MQTLTLALEQRACSIGRVIARGHVHRLQPFNVWDRPDGLREVQSRCVCSEDPAQSTVLEQKILYDPATGTPRRLQYRFGGMWFDPIDLVRLLPLDGIEECVTCHGGPPAISGLGPCQRCGGVGVTVGDRAIVPPDLTVAA